MSLFGSLVRDPSARVVSAARNVIALQQRPWWTRLTWALPTALSRLKCELASYDQVIERQRQNQRVRDMAREEAARLVAQHCPEPAAKPARRKPRKCR